MRDQAKQLRWSDGCGRFATKLLAMFMLASGVPVSPVAFAWDAGPAECKHDECSDGKTSGYGRMWRGNTHLWLVNRALDQLRGMNTTAANYIAAKMNEPGCRTNWESGLWDTDEKWVDSPSYPGSHFYNPRHLWWDGTTTKATTYLVIGTDQGWYWDNAEAKSQAASRIAAAGGLLTDNQCYQLGRALHYLTDMTQPMHVTSFSGVTAPMYLHPVWEMYVVPLVKSMTREPFDGRFQSNVPCAIPNKCTSDEVFEMTAWRTTDHPSRYLLMNELTKGKTYTAPDRCSYSVGGYNYNGGNCFAGSPLLDTYARHFLSDGVHSVTAYLYSLRNNIAVVRQTAGCKSGEYWGLSNTLKANTGSYELVEFDGAAGSWKPKGVAANYLAVGASNCEVWTADAAGNVTGPTGGKTVLAKAKGLAVGVNGDVWMIDQANVPAKLNRADMQFYEPGAGALSGLPAISRVAVSKIAVSPAGVLHAVVVGSYIVHRLGADNQWSALPGLPTAREIAFASDGTLWAIGTADQDRDKQWTTVPADDDQGPFDPNYNIQYMNGASAWTIPQGSAVNIDASASSVTVLTRQGMLWGWTGTTWVALPMRLANWT